MVSLARQNRTFMLKYLDYYDQISGDRMIQKGFSLVELAITLVVIGMIVAAITAGGHLMQAARINKIISELAGYKEAVEDFQLKFHSFPGDMPNATNFWDDTVNGNGNEQIAGDLTERLRAWQHLSKAKIITGNYSGEEAGTPDFQIGINVPGSVIKEAYYLLGYTQVYDATAGRVGNGLQLVTTEDSADPSGSVLTSADARIIDKKLDEDADPAAGNIYVLRSDNLKATNDSCVSTNYVSATSADYVTSDKTTSCRLLLWLD